MFIFLSALVVANAASDFKIERYRAEARDDRGRILYTELHETSYDKTGRVQKAQTIYNNPNGEEIARMTSDFSVNITAPAYEFYDHRSGTTEGLRYQSGQVVLFVRDLQGHEKNSPVDGKSKEGSLVVGCQGLHYYLKSDLAQVGKGKEIPVRVLIPGKLSTYDFKMQLQKEEGGKLYLKLVIENWFLRLFAPSLEVVYEKKSGRILKYDGLSNLKGNNGRIQNVSIDYFY